MVNKDEYNYIKSSAEISRMTSSSCSVSSTPLQYVPLIFIRIDKYQVRLCSAMLCISAAYAVVRCLSVRLFVCQVRVFC